MEDKILINTADVNQIKAFYGLETEDIMLILKDNTDKLSNCPDYCELKQLFVEIKGY